MEAALSIRGSGTRHGFDDCLYHFAVDTGIRVFRDDEEIPSCLMARWSECRYPLYEHYASSKMVPSGASGNGRLQEGDQQYGHRIARCCGLCFAARGSIVEEVCQSRWSIRLFVTEHLVVGLEDYVEAAKKHLDCRIPYMMFVGIHGPRRIIICKMTLAKVCWLQSTKASPSKRDIPNHDDERNKVD